jgi:hypothetical protein
MDDISTIPTNERNGYATKSLLNKLVAYEESKEAYEKGLTVVTDYFWFDNTPWNKKEPIGIMTAEYALEESKGCCFIDLDTTIPAFTKEQLNNFHHVNSIQQ